MKVATWKSIAALFVGVALLPAGVQAQSSITGAVRDETGGALPGVTVEASSPDLIGITRVVFTDNEGLYRLIDLRPGTYAVTLTLPGFDTIRREGITLQANFTATVNVEMPVGTISETLTVSGIAPVVDTQNTRSQTVLTKELLEALPSSRTWGTNTVPAITRVVDVGGSSAVGGLNLKAYGDNEYWNVIRVEGMNVNAAGTWPGIYYNFDSLEEVVYQVGGGDAEATSSGVIVNMIPRQGGNQLSSDTTVVFSNNSMTSSNINDELRSQGLTAPSALHHLHDINTSLGGAIGDKFRFFASVRNWTTDSFKANAFNADGTQAIDKYKMNNATGRLTYQLSPRNKISAQYDFSSKVQGSRGFGNGFSPEATYRSRTSKWPPSGNSVTKFTSAVSNKLFVDVGYSTNLFQLYGVYQPEVALPSATDPFGDIAKRDVVLGRTFGAAPTGETYLQTMTYNLNASVTYVTGSHAFKVGQQFSRAHLGSGRSQQNGSLVQQYREGVPDSVVVYNTPTIVQTDLDYKIGFYVQDSWRVNRRLTLNPGFRYDRHRNSIPAQTASAGRFVPDRSFAAIPGIISWDDFSPRVGAVYDVSGDGRTAIKASIGKYPVFEIANTAARFNPMTATGGVGSGTTDTRTWDDLNGDDLAQENEIGPTTNSRFGLGLDRNVDPNLTRPYSWMTSLGIQHELFSGWGVSATYTRRDQSGLRWSENLETTFDDYTLLTIADPRDNGQTLPLYNLNIDKLGLVDLYDTNSDENRRYYDGVEVSVAGRFSTGATIFVASSTGRVQEKTCEVSDPNGLRFCDQTELDSTPFITSFRVVGNYPLPRGFGLAAVFQITPGGRRGQPIYATNYRVSRAIVPNLTLPSVTVRLDEPGSQRYDHIKQLDISLSKQFEVGGFRLSPRLELHNALNASPILGQVTTFGSALGTPQRILPGRMVRLYASLKF